MNKLREVLMLFFFVGIVFLTEAQNTQSMQNLGTVNVDELSDDQIKKFLDQAESSGYSEQQLEVLAQARGMSASQVAKLRQRIAKVRSANASSGTIQTNVQANREDPLKDGADPLGFLAERKEDGQKIFGMSFFSNPNISFESPLNIATPQGYQIGPGDQIVINVWGASEQTYQLKVSPEGSIIVPSLGPIYLSGLSVERAKSRITSRLKNIYSTLGSNTYAEISLGQIRTISVNVIGEVQKPGTYQMSSFTTAFNALYFAGGPNVNGTMRRIKVIRGGREVDVLDAYDFLVTGETENIMLQDQDVLLVEPYLNRVSITGKVKRPALYELMEGETLDDLLQFSGGFTPEAYTRSISLRRNLTNGKTVQTLTKDQFRDFKLQSGDVITVGEIRSLFTGRVTIEGAVNHPGEYELSNDLMLSDLIHLADGFSPDVFLNRAIILRQNDDFTLTTIAFAPREVINGSYDLQLQSEDVIKVSTLFDLRQEWTVSIQGEVQAPQTSPYSEGMTVEDLIYLANGFKETAARSFVEVARRLTSTDQSATADLFNFPISTDLSISEEASNFTLEPFDVVIIRKSPYYEKQQVVEVEGEVLFPGKYVLQNKSERISDVINRTGGFTSDAFPAGGTLIRQTEYFDESSAALVKKLRIQALGNQDSTTASGAFSINRNESIAIELKKIMDSPGSQFDLILKEGDVISIPKELQTVRVRGEVYFSSNLLYNGNKNFRKYLSEAGGATDEAKLSKAYIVYPNGSARKTSSFLWFKDFPNVEPGSEIIVPRKPEKRKLSPQEVIGIASGIGTLALIINNLTR